MTQSLKSSTHYIMSLNAGNLTKLLPARREHGKNDWLYRADQSRARLASCKQEIRRQHWADTAQVWLGP